ncbi:MAG: hypothetical protein JRI23_29250 [Deltaproteobacteria bacterium]|jgi:hypothetical protein|nr:hypothetical protein [Deltaproteobacteria bacterium]MBW2536226.1 hypothetical protein [Deltaproteobacteria bacterium]
MTDAAHLRPSHPPARPALVSTLLVAAVGLGSAGCAPKWTGSQVLTAASTVPTVPLAPDIEPEERLRRHYAALPLGEQVRAKRLKVLVVHVGDVAIHRIQPDRSPPTYSAILRSYTSFRDRSLEDVDDYLDNVDRGYTVASSEVEQVRRFIRKAVEEVTYYRIDLRYTADESHGAVLVYEFVEEGEDRLLDSMLLTPQTTLSAIHFADQDGFALDVSKTALEELYRVALRDGKLEIQRRE